MTTFEHGKAPAWATKTWTMDDDGCCLIQLGDGSFEHDHVISIEDPGYADHLCRALSLAKLAEDWAAATRKAHEIFGEFGEMFAGNAESDEACTKLDAARAALMKACAE